MLFGVFFHCVLPCLWGVTKGVRRSDLIIGIINEIFNENINKIVGECWGCVIPLNALCSLVLMGVCGVLGLLQLLK